MLISCTRDSRSTDSSGKEEENRRDGPKQETAPHLELGEFDPRSVERGLCVGRAACMHLHVAQGLVQPQVVVVQLLPQCPGLLHPAGQHR